MILTFKYRLCLTPEQLAKIESWMGAVRLVYNLGLEIKEDAFKKGIKISFNEIGKQIKDIRKDYGWLSEVPYDCLYDSINKLKLSYQQFWNGGGIPSFRSKKRGKTISFRQNKVWPQIRQHSPTEFRLQKIGVIKVREDRPVEGNILCATIKKEIDNYYLHIQSEVGYKHLPQSDNQAGVDIGISNIVATSDGDLIENPKYFQKSIKALRREQRKLSRRKLGGKNFYKQCKVVATLHEKIRMQRADFLQKLSTRLIKENGLIVAESIKVDNLKSKRLAKSISDIGWHTLREMLSYKAALYGRKYLEVNSLYTSQECSVCGCVTSENRKSQSQFKCTSCGHELHADHNAALNILKRGQRLLAQSGNTSSELANVPPGCQKGIEIVHHLPIT